METIARIRRDHLDRGVPIRQIARELKLSRNTVRKAIRGDVASFRYERSVQAKPQDEAPASPEELSDTKFQRITMQSLRGADPAPVSGYVQRGKRRTCGN